MVVKTKKKIPIRDLLQNNNKNMLISVAPMLGWRMVVSVRERLQYKINPLTRFLVDFHICI